ncbi:MAG: RNA pseudouridine synthase [Spirochaetaceae bacterium]|nr:RNA pseudouridine synthase [Spirochaetaceae bacterium]
MRQDFPAKAVLEPELIAETADYIVVYKPPAMHTVPLYAGESGTLLDWITGRFPEIRAVRGKKACEGGIVHRLDFETRGLVLAARNQRGFDFFVHEQKSGRFIKEYRALTAAAPHPLPGFPPRPPDSFSGLPAMKMPFVIESAFRPFGPGRKAVRPVVSAAGPAYRTEFIACSPEAGTVMCRLRLVRGFRHQIRCHLAWLGHPIINDTLYGGVHLKGSLQLEACELCFADPSSTETPNLKTVRCLLPAPA